MSRGLKYLGPLMALLLAVFAAPTPARGEAEAVPDRIVVLTSDQNYREELRKDLENHWGRRVELRAFTGDIRNPQEVSRTLAELALERDLGAVIVGEAPVGSLEGLTRLRAERPDFLVFVVEPDESLERIGQTASLTISLNHQARGFLYPTMAARMGAGTLVYLSFPRHQERPSLSRQHRIMAAVCSDMGLNLVTDFNGPDPRIASEDVLKKYLGRLTELYLNSYGRQTAFMTTSAEYSRLLAPMIAQNGGALLEPDQPNLLSGGLPEVLGLGEDSLEYFGSWRRLLTLEDEKYLEIRPRGQFASWTYPYPHTAVMGAAELAVAALDGRAGMERQPNVYDLDNVAWALGKFSPGIKWQVITLIDYHSDQILPQVVLILEDTYWFGQGYQGFTRLNIPDIYHRIR